MICWHKLYHFMVANLVLPRRVSGAVEQVFATVKLYNLCQQIIQTQIVLSPFKYILIKSFFKTFSLRCYDALLRLWRRRCFHGINAIILLPQIFDVTANENARYKRNELEICVSDLLSKYPVTFSNVLAKNQWKLFKYLITEMSLPIISKITISNLSLGLAHIWNWQYYY